MSSSRSSYRTRATCTLWLRRRSTRNRKATAASNWAVRNSTWKYRKGCWLAEKWDSPGGGNGRNGAEMRCRASWEEAFY